MDKLVNKVLNDLYIGRIMTGPIAVNGIMGMHMRYSQDDLYNAKSKALDLFRTVPRNWDMFVIIIDEDDNGFSTEVESRTIKSVVLDEVSEAAHLVLLECAVNEKSKYMWIIKPTDEDETLSLTAVEDRLEKWFIDAVEKNALDKLPPVKRFISEHHKTAIKSQTLPVDTSEVKSTFGDGGVSS